MYIIPESLAKKMVTKLQTYSYYMSHAHYTYSVHASRVARSPVFYGRCRISASVSRLPKGSRPGDRISRTWL